MPLSFCCSLFVWLLITYLVKYSVFVCVLAPFQQPPPTGEVLNSSAISLSWNSPDSPNSNHLIYLLYRDEAEIYTAEDYYPYSKFLCVHLYCFKCMYTFSCFCFVIIILFGFEYITLSFFNWWFLLFFHERNEHSGLKSAKWVAHNRNSFFFTFQSKGTNLLKAFCARTHRLQKELEWMEVPIKCLNSFIFSSSCF